ncbi:nif11-class peptide radical SAM maturase 3 [Anabaena cylindrica FACHB-243]|uniref:Radical SAM domain protein n=1 Tax=Anabaena cylindrica (strain ATCC 27899 / PCC 7122) TaxID=272123 RepID=K9ZLP4_ANACC|nr:MULTISPECIES: nif11-class peptide radical SAM maturase 3 [Anabaena]AFZ59472.1 Radical SAM domain protein [Anabaena cylindrica PCC 7122]MBD2417627.1 nif11-class peptide radical SAM maturase 3 [Anabaena cylindrica FACHB-243]MBY5283255.1 nif11-class peptide radical SAM maturase 3 [Anabaena sp. CCAP 1446/1C]MBY5310627.1 nif11-class peptide radical SAM maturase 3 [Anabaena sp. CCAP 1446/1C]MCM2405388.1 nif11-class peptide radical SAM maturase 3 [Anabaena sp. CCAP 1446/1C]
MSYRRISYAVWEITLKCNLACQHCGSRAGHTRSNELSTAEALDLVKQMADVGITEVTIIGGEAFLRPDWLEIAQAITKAGMLCGMTTGGYGITLETAQKMKAAGIQVVSVSVDGLEATHDHIRGKQGSWQWAFKTMSNLKEAGIPFGCNTQINRLSAPEFPRIYEHLRDAGIFAWQIQLTVPMGNAADNSEILLQPYELIDLYPMIAHVAERAKQEGVQVQAGNNIGYYGPYERSLRGGDAWSFWQGCSAGLSALGIEADGAIKGCPSLPTTAYTGGNIRDHSLRTIIEETEELRFNIGAGTPKGIEHLWGFCKTCEFAELCRGGCSWTAHVFFDKRGNNPYCHHRALTQEKAGIRERVFLQRRADGNPFDNGEFALIEEPINTPWPENDRLHFTADLIQWPEGWEKSSELDKSLVNSK